MKNKIKKFCSRCGYKLATYPSDNYDEYTGKLKTQLVCANVYCEEHCGFIIPHQWGKFYLLENWEKCQRCGYVICDY